MTAAVAASSSSSSVDLGERHASFTSTANLLPPPVTAATGRNNPADGRESRALSRGRALAQALDPRPALQAGRVQVAKGVESLAHQSASFVKSPHWARMAHTAALTATAMGISVLVGLATAATVAPWFLRLTLPANNVVTMFTQLPLIGSILTGIIQRGGPFGALCSSLVLWFSTRAMFSQGTLADRRWDWALAAVAVGVALSPMFVPGVPVTGALATGCIMGAAALSYLSSRAHLPQGLGDWRINTLAIAIGVAFAPMGAQAAMLAPPVAILGEALTITTLCTLGIAVHGVISLLAPLFRENVAVRQTQATGGASLPVLDLPAAKEHANVFGAGDIPALCNLMENIKEDIGRGIANRARLIVLRGPEGSGKWIMANALVGSLDIPMERPFRESLQASGHPSSALHNFFKKCEERARVTKRPVAIMIKDIDHLFAQRGQGDAENDQMVNAALPFLEQLKGAVPSNLIIIGTLNNKRAVDGAVASRGGEVFYDVPAPSKHTLSAIVSHGLRSRLQAVLPADSLKDMTDNAWAPWGFTADGLGAQAFEQGLNGRDMDAYAQRLSDETRASWRLHGTQAAAETSDGPSDASGVVTHVLAAHKKLWQPYLKARTGFEGSDR